MNGQCSICYATFKFSDELCSPLCGHIFHCSCLSQWIEKWKTCPHCRQTANPSQVRKLFVYNSEDSEYTKLQKKIKDLEIKIQLINEKLDCCKDSTQCLERQKCVMKSSESFLKSSIENATTENEQLYEWIKKLQTKFDILEREFRRTNEND